MGGTQSWSGRGGEEVYVTKFCMHFLFTLFDLHKLFDFVTIAE
jgi:hypothetical protein